MKRAYCQLPPLLRIASGRDYNECTFETGLRFLSVIAEVPFYFAIPLKAKRFSENWDLVCSNLERTLRKSPGPVRSEFFDCKVRWVQRHCSGGELQILD